MSDSAAPPDTDDGRLDWRRTDDGVEIYDDENPDAWIRMAFVAGAPPEKRLFSICPDCGLVVPQRTLLSRAAVCSGCGAEFDGE